MRVQRGSVLARDPRSTPALSPASADPAPQPDIADISNCTPQNHVWYTYNLSTQPNTTIHCLHSYCWLSGYVCQHISWIHTWHSSWEMRTDGNIENLWSLKLIMRNGVAGWEEKDESVCHCLLNSIFHEIKQTNWQMPCDLRLSHGWQYHSK